ncbi:hypothetical protein KPK_1250 [Klebsiella variicola]|uniref:Uncharacterized protein n=1 Tax=Klebsiella variicola (strain 342) TaxID=507522 RepID=B5XNJ0_KLEV3|nr:hypothetical protein KPK_1250 [Klebsiella variicola]
MKLCGCAAAENDKTMKNAALVHCFTLFICSSREKFCELHQQS